MAGFSELIKNFDKTRDYVRDFFIYGCKVRSDFDRKSVRTYGDEKRRVESWMGDSMRYDDSVRGRSVSISVDSGHIPENPLYNAYYSKSFTDNDIRLHFLIMDILEDGSSRTLREIVDILNDGYGQLFDEQTVRNKLREYADEGIVIAEKQGKTLYYSLSADRADDYVRNIAGLAEFSDFVITSKLQQGTEFTATIKVTSENSLQDLEHLALTFPIASGWEIYNDRLFAGQVAAQNAYDHQDIRDDACIWYFDLPLGTSKAFKLRLRAAYEGSFLLPPVTCEAMYNSLVAANTASGTAVVTR